MGEGDDTQLHWYMKQLYGYINDNCLDEFKVAYTKIHDTISDRRMFHEGIFAGKRRIYIHYCEKTLCILFIMVTEYNLSKEYVTRPEKIDHISANYTELYFC